MKAYILIGGHHKVLSCTTLFIFLGKMNPQIDLGLVRLKKKSSSWSILSDMESKTTGQTVRRNSKIGKKTFQLQIG